MLVEWSSRFCKFKTELQGEFLDCISRCLMCKSCLTISCEGINAPPWLDRYESFVLKVLDFCKLEVWDLSVVLCDDPFIRRLNKKFRNKDEPTDVLSFSYCVTDLLFLQGDLLISLPTLEYNSLCFKVEVEEELKRVTIHGLLHLIGWEHKSNDAQEPMLMRQEEILRQFQGDLLF